MLEDQILVSKQGVRMFLKRYHKHGTIARKEGTLLLPRLSPAVRQVIEITKREDETTTTQLQAKLALRGRCVFGNNCSIQT